MNKQFSRFKRKMCFGAFLKSSFIALAIGLTLSSVFVFLYRLRILNVPDMYALIIGGAVAIISFIVTFRIINPSDTEIAKRVDCEFGLKAKAQTMIANQKSFKPINKLQRQDTEAELAKIPTRRLKNRNLLLSFVPMLLAGVLLTVAMMWPQTPAPKPPTPPGPADDPYEISQWQITALNELISEVEGSALEDKPKEGIVEDLRSLVTTLTNTTSNSAMKRAVVGVIESVRAEIDKANSYAEIRDTLIATENADMVEFAKALGTMSIPMTIETVSQIKELFNEDNQNTRIPIFKGDLENALVASGQEADNMLYKAIADFLTELAAVPANPEGFEAAIERTFENCVMGIGAAIKQQLTNARIGERVELKLIEIFGLTEEDLPKKEDNDGYEDSDRFDDEQKGDDAGIGTGDTIYGSDDEVLDIIDKIRVEYGDVFNQYYPDAMDKVVNSDLPDEVKEFISKYFSYLLGATKGEESNS